MLAILQLCRAANVFTAMADIFVGYLIVHTGIESGWHFGLLLVASSCLYLAGMVFNDVFDRDIDARERPGRPIPSGRVSLNTAIGLGSALILCGLGAAGVAGLQSLLVAGCLLVAIFLYDGVLKSTLAGPLAMGSCRFFNIMLGASLATNAAGVVTPAAIWTLPQLHVAAGMGIYIAGVTFFARKETERSNRTALLLSLVVLNLGLALLMAYTWNAAPDLDRRWRGTAVLAIIAVSINRRALVAVFDPSPQHVQGSIKTMILSIIMLDASLVWFDEGLILAVVVAALLIPTWTLSRFLAVT